MEYGRLEPLKGNSAPEPTAFTKKTIKELLAEEGVDASEAQLQREPVAAAGVEQPPQAQARSDESVKVAFAPLADPEVPAERPKSFLGRLLGR